jgi:hypothetical protein
MSDPHGFNRDPPPRAQWWRVFDREAVRAQLEDATATGLPVGDPLPDSLIAQAQALGLLPAELRMFLLDLPPRTDFSSEALTQWARLYGLDRSQYGKGAT